MAIDHSHFFLVFFVRPTKYSSQFHCIVLNQIEATRKLISIFVANKSLQYIFINQKKWSGTIYVKISITKTQTHSSIFFCPRFITFYLQIEKINICSNRAKIYQFAYLMSTCSTIHIYIPFNKINLFILIYTFIKLNCLIHFSWKHLMCGFDGILTAFIRTRISIHQFNSHKLIGIPIIE